MLVQDKDAHLLEMRFAQANIRSTRLSTTGDSTSRKYNFPYRYRKKKRVDEALDIIKENCQSREQMTIPPVHIDSMLDSAMLHLFLFE